MSEKVKVTENQHTSLKYATTHESNQSIIKRRVFCDIDKELMELKLDELIRALYIGYEVDPEFKIGDWVIHKPSREIGKVRYVGSHSLTLENNSGGGSGHFRHATPEEIAEEKERIWWNKHGRDVWELRERDFLVNKDGIAWEVTSVNPKEDYCSIDYTRFNYEEIMRAFRVLCFAENRLDLKENA